MSSFTMLGRGTPSSNHGNTPASHQQSNSSAFGALPSGAPPMQAPYPRADAGQAGVANRYPATAGQGNYHLSPMTPQPQYQQQQQQQQNQSAIAAPPMGAFNFTPVPNPNNGQQQQQPQQGAPAAGNPNSDAMRDYVANLRAQVANLKTEVDANPAAGRRLSGSQAAAGGAGVPQQQLNQTLPPTGMMPSQQQQQQQQQQYVPPTPASHLQVHGTNTGSSSAPQHGRSSASTPGGMQRPSSASRANTGAAASTRSNLASTTIGGAGARSPASAGRTGGRTTSVPRKAGGKTSMAQRVMALREDLKAHEENEERLTNELQDIQGKFSNTSGELDSTRQMLLATDTSLRELSARHGNLEAEYKETCRQLASSTTHGETLEAQVSVFRRAKELEVHEDRLFTYFLRHCLCTSCIPGAAEQGEIPPVTEDVPEKLRNQEVGRLAMADENQYHCTENGSPIKLDADGKPALRIPHEIAILVNKHFDELSSRADSQRAQIAQLNETIKRRDDEIGSLNENCKALQNSLDVLRSQHRDIENKLLIETSEKAAANLRCDDAVRMVHLLKANLRQTLEENDRIARELDKQLTRIQVIDANEAMHNNRHDDAAQTIEVRTTEIRQLRVVIETMKNNEDNLADENRKLREAARQLQEQIRTMRTRFDELSDDVSKRLQEQAQRVNEIEDHTMKLATTAVQAQMAEQEASKQAQRLIDQMRSESAETQKRTAAVVNDMHSLPNILLPEQARTTVPAMVVSSIQEENYREEHTNGENNRSRSPPNSRNSNREQPRYGPLSPAGRLGTALAEATAYGTNNTSSGNQHHSDPSVASASSRPKTPAGLNDGTGAAGAASDDQEKLQHLLTPVKMPGDQSQQEKPLDPTEALAAQIRATLAMNAEAGSKLDEAIAHANSTIGPDT